MLLRQPPCCSLCKQSAIDSSNELSYPPTDFKILPRTMDIETSHRKSRHSMQGHLWAIDCSGLYTMNDVSCRLLWWLKERSGNKDIKAYRWHSSVTVSAGHVNIRSYLWEYDRALKKKIERRRVSAETSALTRIDACKSTGRQAGRTPRAPCKKASI